MRKPTVENKYKLTFGDLKHLRVVDRSKLQPPLFWRNNVINAWCSSGDTARTDADRTYGTYSSFWIGIYDEDAKSYANKVRVSCDAFGGMMGYKPRSFFDPAEISSETDLRVQELLLTALNELLDQQIIELDSPAKKTRP